MITLNARACARRLRAARALCPYARLRREFRRRAARQKLSLRSAAPSTIRGQYRRILKAAWRRGGNSSRSPIVIATTKLPWRDIVKPGGWPIWLA